MNEIKMRIPNQNLYKAFGPEITMLHGKDNTALIKLSKNQLTNKNLFKLRNDYDLFIIPKDDKKDPFATYQAVDTYSIDPKVIDPDYFPYGIIVPEWRNLKNPKFIDAFIKDYHIVLSIH